MGICILYVVEIVEVSTNDRADILDFCVCGEASIVKLVQSLLSFSVDVIDAVTSLIFEFVDSLMNFLKLVSHRWVTK